MAWLANPFAYIAINTFIPMLPTLAAHFHLTPMFAGFACSLWGFVRLGTFIALWLWTDWHYRFRWLVTAFATAHRFVRGDSHRAESRRAACWRKSFSASPSA